MAVTDTLITAEEARKLAGPTVEEVVSNVCACIRITAKEKKRRVVLRDDIWVHGGYSNTAEYQEAKRMLEDLGFVVKFHYEERQFVDMYTVVEW